MSDLFSSETDIDFDRAASAFPDISLDGSGEFYTTPSTQAPGPVCWFRFRQFDNLENPLPPKTTDVKVTGDGESQTFESEFPDIDVGPVACLSSIFVLPLSY